MAAAAKDVPTDKGSDGSKETTGKSNSPGVDTSKTGSANSSDVTNKTPPAATGNKTPTQDSSPEMVADNKNRTADVANQAPGVDPQQALARPTSEDPSNQMPGGVGFATRDVPEGHPLEDMSAQEKLKAYCETFVDSSPDSRIVFGSVAVSITMGDLRELAGLK